MTRSGDLSGLGSVDFAVSGIPNRTGLQAVNPLDFVGGELPTGTIDFAAGEASQTLTLTILSEVEPEADERFAVTLSNPVAGGLVADPVAQGVIQNDDLGGILNVQTVQLDRSAEVVSEQSITRVVAQVLRLPDDCGEIHLILAADGSTSVEAFFPNATLTAEVSSLIGALDPGPLPAGATPPALPANIDLATVVDGQVVDTSDQSFVGGPAFDRDRKLNEHQSDRKYCFHW